MICILCYFNLFFMSMIYGRPYIGETITTLPSHIIYYFQSLVYLVYGHFKVFYNMAICTWILRNPNITMSYTWLLKCARETHTKSPLSHHLLSVEKFWDEWGILTTEKNSNNIWKWLRLICFTKWHSMIA